MWNGSVSDGKASGTSGGTRIHDDPWLRSQLAHRGTPTPTAGDTSVRQSLILSPSALDEAFLLGQQAPIRWRFLDDQFVVESWNEPLPQRLCERMLEESGPVYRIGGRWELLDGGHELHVSQLQADGPAVKEQADLAVVEGTGDTLIVEGTPYVLLEHPGHREVLPDANFRGRLVAVQVGHLLTIDHDGPAASGKPCSSPASSAPRPIVRSVARQFSGANN